MRAYLVNYDNCEEYEDHAEYIESIFATWEDAVSYIDSQLDDKFKVSFLKKTRIYHDGSWPEYQQRIWGNSFCKDEPCLGWNTYLDINGDEYETNGEYTIQVWDLETGKLILEDQE